MTITETRQLDEVKYRPPETLEVVMRVLIEEAQATRSYERDFFDAVDMETLIGVCPQIDGQNQLQYVLAGGLLPGADGIHGTLPIHTMQLALIHPDRWDFYDMGDVEAPLQRAMSVSSGDMKGIFGEALAVQEPLARSSSRILFAPVELRMAQLTLAAHQAHDPGLTDPTSLSRFNETAYRESLELLERVENIT